jgi:hypothetical protein
MRTDDEAVRIPIGVVVWVRQEAGGRSTVNLDRGWVEGFRTEWVCGIR